MYCNSIFECYGHRMIYVFFSCRENNSTHKSQKVILQKLKWFVWRTLQIANCKLHIAIIQIGAENPSGSPEFIGMIYMILLM